jgi:hypothetical protein
LDLTLRCNKEFDCADGSDEGYCEPVAIDEKSYIKIYPPTMKDKESTITLKMDIHSIQSIDEIAMEFRAEVSVLLQWRDQRITYKNLAKENNVLDRVWTNQIWLPHLAFSNTELNKRISIDDEGDDSVMVKIIKKGLPESNDLNYLNEGNKFNGSENDLQLSVTHQCNFRCKFDLAEFPFDVQKCSIDIQMPFEYRNLARDHLTIEPKEVAYLGMLS